jgi:hypothetical protein
MGRQPTNAELAVMINGVREVIEIKTGEHAKQDAIDHKGIHDRLDKMNGQIAKNTEGRISGRAFVVMISFMVPVIVSLLLHFVS